MKIKITLLLCLIVKISSDQDIDSIKIYKDSCSTCAKIYLKFNMENKFYWPPKYINYTVFGNTIKLNPLWDTIYSACFLSDYRDTILSICNLAPNTYHVNCNSELLIFDRFGNKV